MHIFVLDSNWSALESPCTEWCTFIPPMGLLRKDRLVCSFVIIMATNMALYTCTKPENKDSPSCCHSGTTYKLLYDKKSSNNIHTGSCPTQGKTCSESDSYSCKDTSANYVRNPSSSAYIPSTCGTNNPTHCSQLALYQPSKVLPIFQEKKREFEIAGRKWIIVQQWNEIGLAAVIWEAVCVCVCCVHVCVCACMCVHKVLEDLLEELVHLGLNCSDFDNLLTKLSSLFILAKQRVI